MPSLVWLFIFSHSALTPKICSFTQARTFIASTFCSNFFLAASVQKCWNQTLTAWFSQRPTSFCGIGNLLSILLTSVNCEQPNLQYKNCYITYVWVMLRVDSEAKATESRRVDLEGFWHANGPTSHPRQPGCEKLF